MRYRIVDIREKTEDDFEKAYNSLPLWRREKADKYRFKEDRKRSVFAFELLCAMLSEYLKVSAEGLEIYESEKGKLRLKNSRLGFNISHSGAFVACAIHEGEIGIDIEEKREISPRLFRSVLSESERKNLLKGKALPEEKIPADSPLTAEFLRLWTAKEAYLKFTGEGLSGGFDKVQVRLTEKPEIIGKGVSLINEDKGEYILSIVY